TQTSAASTPASTFQLNAPADATVQLPGVEGTVLARLCAANLKQLLLQGKTVLQACSGTTRGLTEQALMTALLAATRADLNIAVAARQITRDQAARALAAEQAQLHEFITQSAPKGPASTPPVGK